MENISKYIIKKGFYGGVSVVDIYIPSSAIFIKDNSNCGDGLHDGYYHFLGIAPYKDFYKFLDYMDKEDLMDYISDYYDLGKEWVFFEIKDVDDNNQFNVVCIEEFNNICDFNKYCIVAWDGGELKIIRKIKYIHSLFDIEVIDAEPHCLDRWKVGLDNLFFNNIRKYNIIVKKNNCINMFWKQMIYNALNSMGIPCNKSYNKNIDFFAASHLFDNIINFNCTDKDIITYDKIINFK